MQIPKTVDWRACFIEYLAAERGYSEHTIKAYEADLEQFSEGLGKELLSASVDDIRQFISNRLEQGAGPKTARRELSVIKSFYRFAFGRALLITTLLGTFGRRKPSNSSFGRSFAQNLSGYWLRSCGASDRSPQSCNCFRPVWLGFSSERNNHPKDSRCRFSAFRHKSKTWKRPQGSTCTDEFARDRGISCVSKTRAAAPLKRSR